MNISKHCDEIEMATVLKLKKKTDVSMKHFQRVTVFDKSTHCVGY